MGCKGSRVRIPPSRPETAKARCPVDTGLFAFPPPASPIQTQEISAATATYGVRSVRCSCQLLEEWFARRGAGWSCLGHFDATRMRQDWRQRTLALMDRENRHRADLSPYEQGLMYRRALEAGLFPSNRRLAEALGVSHTWVANVLQVVDLPTVVLDCFRTPLEVQHRHAKALTIALQKDRKELLRRAANLCQAPRKTAPAGVVAALSGVHSDEPETGPGSHPLEHKGKVVGSWRRDAVMGQGASPFQSTQRT